MYRLLMNVYVRTCHDPVIMLQILLLCVKLMKIMENTHYTPIKVAGEESEVACEEYRCSPWWLVMNTVHKLNTIIKIYIL